MAGKEKEAILLCLDVGPSMNQAPSGHATCLESAIDVITLLLQRKLFSESKDEFGVVLFGTQRTANRLSSDGYEHITEARPLGPVDLDLIQYIKNDIQPGPHTADFIDALVVALDLLKESSQGKKFTGLRLLLFSDLGGQFSDDKLEGVINALKGLQVELNFIGPKVEDEDDDDGHVTRTDNNQDDNGPSTSDGRTGLRRPTQKEKTPQQRAGEALLKHIWKEVEGEHYSFSETLSLLSFFEKRAVKQTAWKANLEICPSLQIPVCGYLKVKQSTQKSWKSTYIKGKGKEYTPKTIRSQHLNDDEETEVESEEIIEGHRYGSDIIPISEEDKVNMGYKPPGKVMQVLGFTKQENIKRHQQLGSSVYCFVADPSDQPGCVALSAIINALYETNSVAIVRRTYSARSNPRLACLIPHIKAKYESLLYIELPFMEDLRQYTFSSLSSNKKNQPSDEQLSAVDDLITNMDLMKANVNEDGEEEEALKPKLTFNPYYQRLCQCLMHRALNPTAALPALSPAIAEYLQPPRALSAECSSCVDKIKELFKLERVKKQEAASAESLWKDSDVNAAGPAAKKPRLDDDAVDTTDFSMAGMAKGAVQEVGTVDPVGDFKAMIGQKDQDRFTQASDQMQNRISQLVRDSFGSQFYSKAMECLKTLRGASIELHEPGLFNQFLRKLKEELKEIFKTDFWSQIISEKVTLIDTSESSESTVSKVEATKFLEETTEEEEVAPAQADEDAEDLLDMM
ncbi:X-ray repair cross-complementing protein 5-like [Acanthaster planci]|uniref:X-ray repair cross-complementing protein 5 n=1 Tax=Acanthaster planci TaxID=133434 RepID=A0A8B7ZFD1_ACAPL|nr:X-ray repair cross-complementing protein 5-like [Acanthaster planci]